MYDYITGKDIKVASFIHDELLIENTNIDDNILDDIRKYINDNTGFDMMLECKKTKPDDDDFDWLEKHTPFMIHEQNKDKRNDEIHAKNILNYCPMVREKLLGVMMYDDYHGFWTNDKEKHQAIICRKSHEIFPIDKKNVDTNF